MKKIAIATQNLSIGYDKTKGRGTNEVQEKLNVSLFCGELTCLLGTNGVGKSTLLRTLSRMQTPLSGSIILFDKNIKEYDESELSTLLGLVLTDKTSVGGFTVREVVSLGRYPYTGFFGKLSDDDHLIVDKAMNDVSISYKADSYIAELSDGERQKVMIAKALAQECPIILLDEPTAFLDVVNRFEIMNLLHDLAIKQNKAILLSTHDMELAFALADKLWIVSKDKPMKSGVTEDFIISGLIDEYIGNKRIFFDKQSGHFRSKEQQTQTIVLKADDNILFLWTKNFLERKGYLINTEKKSLDLTIKVKNNRVFEIYRGEKKLTVVSSFEGLASYLEDECK